MKELTNNELMMIDGGDWKAGVTFVAGGIVTTADGYYNVCRGELTGDGHLVNKGLAQVGAGAISIAAGGYAFGH